MTDFRQDKAIYLQMYERICDGILSGRYGPGDRIPSVRELSEQLEVNTNTVVRAYDQLVRREIVYTRRGIFRVGAGPGAHTCGPQERVHGRAAARTVQADAAAGHSYGYRGAEMEKFRRKR